MDIHTKYNFQRIFSTPYPKKMELILRVCDIFFGFLENNLRFLGRNSIWAARM